MLHGTAGAAVLRGLPAQSLGGQHAPGPGAHPPPSTLPPHPQAQLDESCTEATSLREALGSSQARAEALQVSLNGASKDLRDTRAALDETRRELQQVPRRG